MDLRWARRMAPCPDVDVWRSRRRGAAAAEAAERRGAGRWVETPRWADKDTHEQDKRMLIARGAGGGGDGGGVGGRRTAAADGHEAGRGKRCDDSWLHAGEVVTLMGVLRDQGGRARSTAGYDVGRRLTRLERPRRGPCTGAVMVAYPTACA